MNVNNDTSTSSIDDASLGVLAVRSLWAKRWARRLFMLFGVLIVAVGAVNYGVLVWSQQQIIEHEALRIAQVVTDEASVARTVYTRAFADQLTDQSNKQSTNQTTAASTDARVHENTLPIPSTFLKLVGREISQSNNNLYSYRPLSKWNIEPTQGLNDDFQRWAWSELEKQDQAAPANPIAWRSVWRIENLNGTQTLRFLKADPAANDHCVQCHSAAEQTPEVIKMRLAAGVKPGKRFALHQLLGAIEADVPIDRVQQMASANADTVLITILLTSFSGLALFAWVAFYDLRARDRMARHFEQQARSDALTGLGNRAMFRERARGQLEFARNSRSQYALLYLDLDGFKQVNDNHGHSAGDKVLTEVAKRLQAALRESDIVSRHGGDEFLILTGGQIDRPRVEVVIRKVLDALHVPIDLDGVPAEISASIGVAIFPNDAEDLDGLIDCADRAMYEAKRKNTKGAWVLWSDCSESEK